MKETLMIQYLATYQKNAQIISYMYEMKMTILQEAGNQ